MKKRKIIAFILALFFMSVGKVLAADFLPNSGKSFDYVYDSDENSAVNVDLFQGSSIFDDNSTVVIDSNSKHFLGKIFNRKKYKNNETITPEVVDINENKSDSNISSENIEIKQEKKKKKKDDNKINMSHSNVNIFCDDMKYVEETKEIVGTGHAKVVFTENNSTMYADKIVYNHDLNYIEGIDNVRIIRDGRTVDGDYTKIDLNYGNAMVDKPIVKDFFIKVVANTGNVTTDTIEAYDGIITARQNMQTRVDSPQFSSFFQIESNENIYRKFYPKEYRNKKTKYHIKTKEIYVKSTDGHDVVEFKNADLYLGKVLLMKGGNISVSTDKTESFAESTIPEIGSMRYVGMYAGPGFVFNTPLSSTLKFVPMVTYDEGKFGIGALVRFRQKRNLTQLIYGTSANELVLRGMQQFGDSDFYLEYARLSYANDWFFGSNLSKYLAQLAYNKKYIFPEYGMSFAHRATAGYLTDEFGNGGTSRFRYMAQFAKELYSYNNYNRKFYTSLSLVTQGMMSVYGTGDTAGVFRIGPSLRTQYKGWGQTISYFQSGVGGASPLPFTDDYRYGKSTVQIIESLRINKYLSIGLMTILNLIKEEQLNGNMFAETRFMVSIGPEEGKFSFGYDFIRQATVLNYSALLGSKNQDISFKKLFIKNPNKIANEEEKPKKERKFKIFNFEESPNAVPSTVDSMNDMYGREDF